ncbi:NifU family protein [Candidatus Uhrbacteria bacterium]|nr:NifU family protein [Candidatus Uhrbacteria bacterium]
MQQKVESLLDGLKPIFAMQDKTVEFVSATEDEIVLKLGGFCGGGCGCSDTWIEGLKEMLTAEFPQSKINFI